MSYFILVICVGYLLSSKPSPSAEEIAKKIEWHRQYNENLRKLKSR